MRNILVAKKELKLMKEIMDEFVQDYEYALNEEPMSNKIHQEFTKKIGDAYWKYKDLESMLNGL